MKIHFFSRKDRQHNGKKKKDKPISTKPYNENQNVINMNPTKTHEEKVVPAPYVTLVMLLLLQTR